MWQAVPPLAPRDRIDALLLARSAVATTPRSSGSGVPSHGAHASAGNALTPTSLAALYLDAPHHPSLSLPSIGRSGPRSGVTVTYSNTLPRMQDPRLEPRLSGAIPAVSTPAGRAGGR